MAERTLPQEVTIPGTIAAATKALGGLDRLLTAKGWERAAIVYAFTTSEVGGGPRTARIVVQLSIREFADLGISGLTTQDTIRKLRGYWEEAGGRKTVKPGQTVKLPKDGFPPMKSEAERTKDERYQVTNGLSSGRLTSEEKAAAVMPAFTDKVVVEKVIENLSNEDLGALQDAIEAANEKRVGPAAEREVLMGGSSVYADVTRSFARAASEIERATRRLDGAIAAGTKFEAEEFEGLANQPESLDPYLTSYRKNVGMVATHSDEVNA